MLVAEVGRNEGCGQSFGLYNTFWTFGTVVGPIVIGVLIARVGFGVSFGITGMLFVFALFRRVLGAGAMVVVPLHALFD